MKNRVLRSALAVILVIAMVLTMAACGDDTTAATTAPVATTTPTEAPVTTAAPTVAPATTAPTVAPTTSVEKDTVADDFGIFLEAYDGTYGTEIENADGDDIEDYIEGEKFIGGTALTSDTVTESGKVYGYWKIGYSSSKVDDEDYDIVIKTSNGETIYDNTVTKPNASSTISASKIYDGDVSSVADLQVIVLDEDEIYILAKSAGAYELELEITITEAAQSYGAWDYDTDRDEYEVELASTLTIAKEEITIEIDPIVAMENEDAELKLSTAFAVQTVEDTTATYSTFPSTYSDIDDMSFVAYADCDTSGEYAFKYEMSYVKEAAVGTYAVEVSIVDSKGDEVEIDDLNDILVNQTIVAIEDTCIYVVSEYDWNELRDVATSIGEIVYADGVGFINATGANYKTQLPLAAARYAALSAEQQAFFQTGTIAQLNASSTAITQGYVTYWYGDLSSTPSSYIATDARAFYEFMDDAQEAVDDQIIIDAFEDVVDDADLLDYIVRSSDGALYADLKTSGTSKIDAMSYLTSNSSAITAFNTVDTYWNSLSDDDQEVIEETASADTSAIGSFINSGSLTASAYDQYIIAKDAFDAAEVDSVVELIVGAYSAYTKALANGATVIYQDTTSDEEWAYINSTEVKTLTAQAQAAFDALTDDQKDLLEVTEAVYDGTESADQLINYASGTTKVTVEAMDIDEVLEALTDMNEMIATMITIVNYVNIEDYSASADAIVYARLKALVYGTELSGVDSGTGLAGMYFPEYTTGTSDAVDEDYRFAMEDIISAPARNYDAIIAEYQAWIDLVIAFEDYKSDLVDAFEAGVLAEIADLYEDDDYSEATLSTYSEMDSTLADAVIDAIMDETTITIGSKDYTVAVVFKADFLGKTEEISEIEEMFEDYLDIDDIIDAYIDAIPTK